MIPRKSLVILKNWSPISDIFWIRFLYLSFLASQKFLRFFWNIFPKLPQKFSGLRSQFFSGYFGNQNKRLSSQKFRRILSGIFLRRNLLRNMLRIIPRNSLPEIPPPIIQNNSFHWRRGGVFLKNIHKCLTSQVEVVLNQ